MASKTASRAASAVAVEEERRKSAVRIAQLEAELRRAHEEGRTMAGQLAGQMQRNQALDAERAPVLAMSEAVHAVGGTERAVAILTDADACRARLLELLEVPGP